MILTTHLAKMCTIRFGSRIISVMQYKNGMTLTTTSEPAEENGPRRSPTAQREMSARVLRIAHARMRAMPYGAHEEITLGRSDFRSKHVARTKLAHSPRFPRS